MCDFVFAVATGNAHKVQEIQAVLGPLGVRVLTAAEAGAPADFSPEENGATFEENSRIKALALLDAILSPAAGADHGSGFGFCAGSGLGACSEAARIDGVIADDSGLCVDALGGIPGVYSARFADMPPTLHAASQQSADARNNAKLLRLLDGIPASKRTARFVCVITLILPRGGSDGIAAGISGGDADMIVGAGAYGGIGEDAGAGELRGVEIREIVCRGECEGHILTAPQGSNGFGYDPLFAPSDAADAADAADAVDAADAANTSGQSVRTFAEMTPDEKNAISHRARALSKLYDALSERA
jgi:XTP/dITP diphosphohydrolase